MLKKASSDPLFLSDIVETVSDFKNSDNELLWNFVNGAFGELI